MTSNTFAPPSLAAACDKHNGILIAVVRKVGTRLEESTLLTPQNKSISYYKQLEKSMQRETHLSMPIPAKLLLRYKTGQWQ